LAEIIELSADGLYSPKYLEGEFSEVGSTVDAEMVHMSHTTRRTKPVGCLLAQADRGLEPHLEKVGT
jgi:hypothetical protein